MLDDYAIQRSFTFFDSLHSIRDRRMEFVKQIYKEILSQPFRYDKDEFIETNGDKIKYVSSEEELKERWLKILKYRSMIELRSKLDRQEKAIERNDSSFVVKSYEDLESESRDRIKKQFDRWFTDLGKEDREDRIADYLNTLANVLEPHTGYFPPLKKEILIFESQVNWKELVPNWYLRMAMSKLFVLFLFCLLASRELGVNDLIIVLLRLIKKRLM